MNISKSTIIHIDEKLRTYIIIEIKSVNRHNDKLYNRRKQKSLFLIYDYQMNTQRQCFNYWYVNTRSEHQHHYFHTGWWKIIFMVRQICCTFWLIDSIISKNALTVRAFYCVILHSINNNTKNAMKIIDAEFITKIKLFS